MLKNSASGSFLAALLTPVSHKLPKYKAHGYRHDLNLLNDVALIACFISSEKWMQRRKVSKWLTSTSPKKRTKIYKIKNFKFFFKKSNKINEASKTFCLTTGLRWSRRLRILSRSSRTMSRDEVRINVQSSSSLYTGAMLSVSFVTPSTRSVRL